MNQKWQPSFGALPCRSGVCFRVWAPTTKTVEVILEEDNQKCQAIPLRRSGDGVFEEISPHAGPGTRYRFLLDGKGPFPDPVSKFQPDGVHGPSEVIDSSSYAWTDANWKGPEPEKLIIYELHVGTFTPSGSFAGVVAMLPKLVELGVTALELMPIGDFPGSRGWGYDGVSLYATARCYGTPKDLCHLVDNAHRLGIAILLDVVYNHLGPDGNYLSQFSPYYFSTSHHTNWGQGPNFDGQHSEWVRQFFIENALHWIHDYHIDGLRLDATHAILDESSPHILDQLTQKIHAESDSLGRRVLVIAEDERNLNQLVNPRTTGGFGMDGVWADDFHHQVRRALAGDKDGYFADFTGTAGDIAATIRQGWYYQGQISKRMGRPRGTDPTGIPSSCFIVCIQNHDQIGNRAFGERLNHQVDESAFRAASALLLLAPQTPLIFMGQEWAASSPFLYFTDHNPELGKLVTEGRRKEFSHFHEFSAPFVRTRIPDPQAMETFKASILNWEEQTREPHAGMLRLYRDLLKIRKTYLPLSLGGSHQAQAISGSLVMVRRIGAGGEEWMVLVALRPGAVVAVHETGWSTLLTTEDQSYTPFSRRPDITTGDAGPVVHFPCPAAVLLYKTRH